MKINFRFTKVLLIVSAVPLFAFGCNQQVPSSLDEFGNQLSQQVGQQVEEQIGVPVIGEQVGSQVEQKVQETIDQTLGNQSVISYDGVEGKTALELLRLKHKVESENYSGLGEFVKSINGIIPSSDSFWAFYVNGKSSSVGASSYQTKAGDKIEWKIEKVSGFNP